MINTNQSFIIHNYFEIFLQRIWYIIIPFVIVMTGTGLYLKFTQKSYKATTVVLVTAQKIPESFIKSTVTSDVQDRLLSIGQELLSRPRLEKMIKEFGLYSEEVKSFPMERVLEMMRKDIVFEVNNRGGAGMNFTLSYIGKNPNEASWVSNKLASMLIEENLKLREQQALGTVEFLSNELTSNRQKLEENEKNLTNFKKQHLNELPEQRDANIRVLDQLQVNSQRINESLKSAEDRKLIIQNKLADMELQDGTTFYIAPMQQGKLEVTPALSVNPREHQLNLLKAQLVDLQTRYTDNHPDILSTKRKIADLEKKIIETPVKKEKGEKTDGGRPNFHYQELKNQLAPIELEIKRLRAEDARNKAMIAEYRTRIENTPTREVAISQLLQNYNQTKDTYQSLLKKRDDALQAENMERRQKGEQFRVIDPARPPEFPFKPDFMRTILIGFLAGLGSGFGLAFLREQMDRSFKESDDVEATLGLRVLANIPKIKAEAV
jgi:polysaccharide chain length determinant protein (PEP-CTERM system associated)